jgi:predicted nucleic acid-binding protein
MLIDTAGFMLYLDADSEGHAEALTLYRADDAPLTHSLVLAELIALLTSRRQPRSRVLGIVGWLTGNTDLTMVWVEADLQREAVELLKRHDDKDYSLCDAVSFLLMQAYGLTEALTTDRHFRQAGQAGFQALLEQFA